MSKTAFITDTLREAALKVTARAETILMDHRLVDAMLASLAVADDSAPFADLAGLPRRISW